MAVYLTFWYWGFNTLHITAFTDVLLQYGWWVWGFPLIWCKETHKALVFVKLWWFLQNWLVKRFLEMIIHVSERGSPLFGGMWLWEEFVSSVFGQSGYTWMICHIFGDFAFSALQGQEQLTGEKQNRHRNMSLCFVSCLAKGTVRSLSCLTLFWGFGFVAILVLCLHLDWCFDPRKFSFLLK